MSETLQPHRKVAQTMPPKKTAAKKAIARKAGVSGSPTSRGCGTSGSGTTRSATCGICEQLIIDGKEQALFCEGVCKQWIHRYCAGVPLSWFTTLSESSTAFQCYSCCQTKHAETVEGLSTQIELLKHDVCELKETVRNLTASCNVPCDTQQIIHNDAPVFPPPSQLDVVNGGNARGEWKRRRGGTRGRGGGRGRGVRMGLGTGSQENSSAGKVRVEGARRVWGTMKVTSSSTLKHGISRVFSVSDLQIKRKTILDNAGEVKRWWFVVHAPESVLCDLDSAWKSLNLQTGWKLEPCYKPGSQPLATMHSLCHNGNVSQVSTEDLPASNSPITASATVDTNTSSESCPFLVN